MCRGESCRKLGCAILSYQAAVDTFRRFRRLLDRIEHSVPQHTVSANARAQGITGEQVVAASPRVLRATGCAQSSRLLPRLRPTFLRRRLSIFSMQRAWMLASIQARCMEKMDKRRRKKVGRSRGRSRDDCAQPVARSTRGDAATTCSPVIPCARAFALTVCCGTLCSMRSNSLRNRRNVSTAAWYDKIAHPSLRHDSPLHIQSIRKSLHGVGRSY